MNSVISRTADEVRAIGAASLDDVDMLVSPSDGTLVVVAVKEGQHVCQQCGGCFDETRASQRSAEVSLQPGSPRIKLHSQCVRTGDSFVKRVFDVFQGLQRRREAVRLTRPFVS